MLDSNGDSMLVSHANIGPIYIDASQVSNALQGAAQSAADMWNAVPNSAVDFVLYNGHPDPDIVISYDTVSANDRCRGYADPPSAGAPGSWLTVLPYCDGESEDDQIALLAHELGHTIGLAHVGDGPTIAGTPPTDGASIMHTNITALELSQYDSVAIQSLYPATPFNLSSYQSSQSGYIAFESTTDQIAGWDWSTNGYSGWTSLTAISSCGPKYTKAFNTGGGASQVYLRARRTDGSTQYLPGAVTINLSDTRDVCYQLTVEREYNTDPGSAIVQSDIGGMYCTMGWGAALSSCKKIFHESQQVTLTQSIGYGLSFQGWSRDCSGWTCTVSMTANRIVAPTYSCGLPGFIYYDSSSYIIDLWDHVSCYPVATNVSWTMSGDVGSPSYCMGSRSECLGYSNVQIAGPCDPDASFSVTFYDSSWAIVSQYELSEEIYQPDCS